MEKEIILLIISHALVFFLGIFIQIQIQKAEDSEDKE